MTADAVGVEDILHVREGGCAGHGSACLVRAASRRIAVRDHHDRMLLCWRRSAWLVETAIRARRRAALQWLGSRVRSAEDTTAPRCCHPPEVFLLRETKEAHAAATQS